MPMNGAEAIEVALEVYRKPARARSLHRHDLPAGLLNLIKIAAGTEDEVKALLDDNTVSALPIKEAAVFYLQQMLMQAEDDDYRQLGLRRGATLQDLKDHKRWLLKWLHPDRNRNTWENVLFKRVAAAAQRLEAALRDGVAVPVQYDRRKSHRRQKAQGWKISQKRVKQEFDWRPRVKKIALAFAVFIIVVGTAHAVLSVSNGNTLNASVMPLAGME
jgi:hypothetical protein